MIPMINLVIYDKFTSHLLKKFPNAYSSYPFCTCSTVILFEQHHLEYYVINSVL